MRLFGRIDGSINRLDRAVWLTGGPWGGFDLAIHTTGYLLLETTSAPAGLFYVWKLG